MTAAQLRLDDVPGPRRQVRRIRRNAEATIVALRKGGRLEAGDALLVALARTVADRCDELRGVDGAAFHESQALRLMVEVDQHLRNLGAPANDAFDQLLAAVSGPAPPGHPA
jgi:hypothetical protein